MKLNNKEALAEGERKGVKAYRNKLFIKDIENLSGIKAHTIRIWEQRYKIFEPYRTDTGIRYYDENQLRLILNISILNNNGIKISKIAEMSIEEIQEKCQEFSENKSKYDGQIQQLVSTMVAFDEKEFNKIISIIILKIGLEQTMMQLIFPFLDHIGVLWLAGNIHPAHENFIINLIRQKLFVASDSITPSPLKSRKKFLLFSPVGEPRDISILFANYLLRSRGFEVVYLGGNTPFNNLEALFDSYKPDYILSIVSSVNSTINVQGFINEMAAQCKNAKFLISGNQVIARKDLVTPAGAEILFGPEVLIQFLEELNEQDYYEKSRKN